jgi:hypothetical protein
MISDKYVFRQIHIWQIQYVSKHLPPVAVVGLPSAPVAVVG